MIYFFGFHYMTTYPLVFLNLPTTIHQLLSVKWYDAMYIFHVGKKGKYCSYIVYLVFGRILTSPLFMIGPGSDKKLSTELEVL